VLNIEARTKNCFANGIVQKITVQMRKKGGFMPHTMALIAKVIPHHAYRARFQAFDKLSYPACRYHP
jgi:hypothetical protein